MVFPNRSSNRGGRRRGGAATELAVWLPLLVFVLIVAIDFCRLFFSLHNYHQCRPEWRTLGQRPVANGTVTPSSRPTRPCRMPLWPTPTT